LPASAEERMKEHREVTELRVGETRMGPTAAGPHVSARKGIPLLLLPEGLLFEVDASMLLGSESRAALRGLAGGMVRKTLRSLSRLWLSQWEY
jgi:hypothetical protein